jgi:predicted PurR-regulated permease PerM
MMNQEAVNKWVLLLLVFFISAVFLSMIRPFLMAIFLAGIFSALCRPLYIHFEKWFGRRRRLASMITIALIVFVLLLPLAGLLGIITAQAIKVGGDVGPWVQHRLAEPDALSNALKSLPFLKDIEPYRSLVLKKSAALIGSLSHFLISRLSAATLGTVDFLFMTSIMLYTMFFFLMEGDKLLQRILYYLPLKTPEEDRLLDRFVSVTRATLKGAAVIGILQGGLAGMAFAVVGIPSAVFWGAVMAVLSIIPGIGSALVWGPAAIVLVATGHLVKGIGLTVFCMAVVSSLDNLLRPVLVGKDTQMHALMIFFGILGGLYMFGMAGIIIGPIIAALFITIWDIYGLAFRDMLPIVNTPDSNHQPENSDTDILLADRDSKKD